MGDKSSKCKHQKEYDKYIEKHDIYRSNESWGINVSALAKYSKEHHIDSSEITEEFLEQFRTS